MYEYEWKLVKKTVQKYRKTKQGHGSLHTPVYVFGVSERTYHIIRELSWKGIKVKGVLDNDWKKQGMYCCGIPVVSVNTIEKEVKSSVDIFIMSPFWREMEKQLMETGIRKRHIYVIKAIKRIKTVFAMRSLHVYMGKTVYRALRKKYGINTKIFLCPYTGTGDIYLIGTFLQQYIRQKQIENYVLVVVSTACKKVANLFDIKKIEQLPSTDVCSRLISYYMTEPEQCDMEILNDSWGEIYTNPTQWIRGYKGHNFTEMFRKYVFRLSDDTMPQPPTLKNVDDQIDEIFTEYELVRGKTVILSPYATTLADLPKHFWEALVVALQNKGYAVCTNSCGEKEPAIAGTYAVFFPLNIAPQVVEAAGTFIGVRSGFCDVVSCAKARKVILYDKNNWFYNCSAYKYFSLNDMGLCNDAVELEYEGDFQRLRTEILNLF